MSSFWMCTVSLAPCPLFCAPREAAGDTLNGIAMNPSKHSALRVLMSGSSREVDSIRCLAEVYTAKALGGEPKRDQFSGKPDCLPMHFSAFAQMHFQQVP